MTASKAQTILQLCDAWRAAHVRPDGSGVENDSTRQLRLIANGIRFHELDVDELEAACVGLTETMVPRGLGGGFMCPDHQQFWGWCTQLLLTTPMSTIVPNNGTLITQLLESSACLIVGGYSHFWAEPKVQLSKGYDWCLHKLIGKKFFILKYLSYPLLESLLKVHCSSFVEDDGTVKMLFSVARPDGSNRTYNPHNRCSSLRDLFVLLEQSTASSELSGSLQRLKCHFQRLHPTTPFIDLLYRWRNATLHGADQVTAVSGTIFNLCLLLCLDLVRPEYAKWQQAAVQNVLNWKAARDNISPIYYHHV
jgi:hypothetical protein